MSDVIREILNGGLFSAVEEESEGYFTWHGCQAGDAKHNRLCNLVQDFQGYRNLEDARAGEGNLYTFRMCHECHYAALYGEK